MNRKATLGLLVSCLLFLLAGGSGFAQKAEQKAAPKAEEKKPPAHTWIKLAEGIQVLRVQNPSGVKWPEIEALQLSEAEYAKFEANPTDYVNDHHIFAKDVNEVFIGHVPRYEKPKPKGSDDMMVVLMHEHPSRGFALSSEAEF
jgi:hypothetical protein